MKSLNTFFRVAASLLMGVTVVFGAVGPAMALGQPKVYNAFDRFTPEYLSDYSFGSGGLATGQLSRDPVFDYYFSRIGIDGVPFSESYPDMFFTTGRGCGAATDHCLSDANMQYFNAASIENPSVAESEQFWSVFSFGNVQGLFKPTAAPAWGFHTDFLGRRYYYGFDLLDHKLVSGNYGVLTFHVRAPSDLAYTLSFDAVGDSHNSASFPPSQIFEMNDDTGDLSLIGTLNGSTPFHWERPLAPGEGFALVLGRSDSRSWDLHPYIHFDATLTAQTPPVPEPATWALTLAGLCMLYSRRHGLLPELEATNRTRFGRDGRSCRSQGQL